VFPTNHVLSKADLINWPASSYSRPWGSRRENRYKVLSSSSHKLPQLVPCRNSHTYSWVHHSPPDPLFAFLPDPSLLWGSPYSVPLVQHRLSARTSFWSA
jgi:hypothetical protein